MYCVYIASFYLIGVDIGFNVSLGLESLRPSTWRVMHLFVGRLIIFPGIPGILNIRAQLYCFSYSKYRCALCS
jgi:hypothetical protein